MGFVPHHSYANLIDLVHAYTNARKFNFEACYLLMQLLNILLQNKEPRFSEVSPELNGAML